MRIHLSFLFTILAFALPVLASPPYNPTVSISKSNDIVDYSIQNGGTGTHIFTLYGDGTCSNTSSPKHKFAPSASGYTTEVYFVKPYQTNVPTLRTVSTGSITAGSSTYANPVLSISGDVDVKTSWGTAYNATNFFIVAFKNSDSDNSVSGCVEFDYNSDDLTVDFNGIKEYNNWVFNRTPSNTSGTYDRKIKWSFSNLTPGETRYIYVPAKVTVTVGNKVKVAANYKVDCEEGNTVVSNASFKSRQYPHDPNYKVVDKPCLEPFTDPQYLEYTIGFYNDGNGFAQNIYLKDDLSQLLDPTSVSVIDSEYPVNWYVQGSVLHMEFIGINLPGTNQTSPASYSYDEAFTYVTFGVCTVPQLGLRDCIINEAEITFDQQPTFVTPASEICCNEECFSAVDCGTSRAAIDEKPETDLAEIEFQVFPNPAKDYIQVVVKERIKQSSIMSIELRDHTGKLIRQLYQYQGHSEPSIIDQSFYIGDLPKGIYLLMVNSGGIIKPQKIVKL